MLKRTLFAITAVWGVALLITYPAVTQSPTPVPSVWLQPTSPGTAQTGNIRLNGKYIGTITQDGAAAITLTANGISVNGMVVNATGTNATGVVSNASGYGFYGTGDAGGVYGVSSTGHGVIGGGGITGVFGQVGGSALAGLRGEHFGSGSGVSGESVSGAGVYGQGGVYGVLGSIFNNGNGRFGVVGEQLGTGTGAGVQGTAVTNNAYGVVGSNSAGIAVIGFSNTASGYGISGQNPGGIAIYGSGGSRGVYGLGGSSDGVYGTTGAASAAGVSGQNTGSGIGVYASSVSGYGIQATGGGFAGIFGSGATNGLYGLTGNSGASGVYGVNNSTGWGVYGTVGGSGTAVAGVNPDPSGYGVYCHGRFTATGTKLFQIDYPFDPENKYLNHYCTEGAEPLNAYSGSIVTDEKGYATVTLPEYFSEINQDPRILLTVVDKSEEFVFAKVVEEVSANQFDLRTSKPHTKVFWRVEAVRNDNWVKTHGFSDVEQKPERYRGTYLNPEFYDEPQSKQQLSVAQPPQQARK